jgi:hypothetical protein
MVHVTFSTRKLEDKVEFGPLVPIQISENTGVFQDQIIQAYVYTEIAVERNQIWFCYLHFCAHVFQVSIFSVFNLVFTFQIKLDDF